MLRRIVFSSQRNVPCAPWTFPLPSAPNFLPVQLQTRGPWWLRGESIFKFYRLSVTVATEHHMSSDLEYPQGLCIIFRYKIDPF